MARIHVFEEAGLGTAPFRFVEMTQETYHATPDSPAQPGTTCDFCGTAIIDACWIKASDGRRFKVGTNCVEKTGDKGLIDPIKRAVTEAKREARHEREWAKIQRGRAQLMDPRVIEALKLQPHPMFSRAEAGETLYDQCVWMMKNAGNKGCLEVCKEIDRVYSEVTGLSAATDKDHIAQLLKLADEQLEALKRQAIAESEARAKAREEAERARVAKNTAENADVIAVLEKVKGGYFAGSIADELRQWPLSSLAERAFYITLDIYAKSFGRRNSKAYLAASSELETRYLTQKAQRAA